MRMRTHPCAQATVKIGAGQGDWEQRNRDGDRRRDFREGCICCPRRSPCEEAKRQSCSMAVFRVRNGVGHGQRPRSAGMPSLSCTRKNKACKHRKSSFHYLAGWLAVICVSVQLVCPLREFLVPEGTLSQPLEAPWNLLEWTNLFFWPQICFFLYVHVTWLSFLCKVCVFAFFFVCFFVHFFCSFLGYKSEFWWKPTNNFT